ncbi:MAG: ATP-dependent metalloprotease [Gammaproteobacteria bacterium]|nr:MAG: ATP-dependent metalloprotease [Gammaproteobacteria bacterium]
MKNFLLWLVIIAVLMFVFEKFDTAGGGSTDISYSEFIKKAKNGEIATVIIDGKNIQGQYRNELSFATVSPETDNKAMIGDLLDSGVNIHGESAQNNNILLGFLANWFPLLMLAGIWFFFMRQMGGGLGGAGGRGNPLSFGKSKAKMLSEDQIKITFDDVAGIDEAKEEVGELVDFLKDPGKYQKLGGIIPRGVLMVGSPGTGKTLIAKAIAGEAKVPFFTISGSDFVEMFVGVGASRVRDMFEQAKKHAPCIIFIDEIDAVGGKRGGGMGGGHDEREQTLNQLLVEMDGFEGNEGVIVLAATNRPEILDNALLRPGRFDRQVVISLPDIRGREKILKVHVRKLPNLAKIDLAKIARGTPGFSGADLANLVNEAALFAAKSDKTIVSMDDFEKAKDKIIMGAERQSLVMDESEKEMTAYHEAGHAIIGKLVPEHDPVYKVSIIPRGRALGVTMFLPDQDRYSHSKQRLESQICSMYGGRIAEELIYGKDKVSTGASNDIERATEIARNMVLRWGLSEKMGPINYVGAEQENYLGMPSDNSQMVSDATAQDIDKEIRKFIDDNYKKSYKLLTDNIDILHAMAKALIKYETIDEKQISNVMAKKEAGEPEDWIEQDRLKKKKEREAKANTKAKTKTKKTTAAKNKTTKKTPVKKPATAKAKPVPKNKK